jgi:hypothetical protein
MAAAPVFGGDNRMSGPCTRASMSTSLGEAMSEALSFEATNKILG